MFKNIEYNCFGTFEETQKNIKFLTDFVSIIYKNEDISLTNKFDLIAEALSKRKFDKVLCSLTNNTTNITIDVSLFVNLNCFIGYQFDIIDSQNNILESYNVSKKAITSVFKSEEDLMNTMSSYYQKYQNEQQIINNKVEDEEEDEL